MVITKEFKTIKQAEKFLLKLYQEYNRVILINYPVFSESGIYQFDVNN